MPWGPQRPQHPFMPPHIIGGDYDWRPSIGCLPGSTQLVGSGSQWGLGGGRMPGGRLFGASGAAGAAALPPELAGGGAGAEAGGIGPGAGGALFSAGGRGGRGGSAFGGAFGGGSGGGGMFRM
jgi:hypothetical protein